MAFYNEKEQLYFEKDMLGVGLGAILLWEKDGMQFPRNRTPNNAALWPTEFTDKSLKSAKTHNSNIGKEALGILHGLEKLHHYCYTHEVRVIQTTNHWQQFLRSMWKAYHTDC